MCCSLLGTDAVLKQRFICAASGVAGWRGCGIGEWPGSSAGSPRASAPPAPPQKTNPAPPPVHRARDAARDRPHSPVLQPLLVQHITPDGEVPQHPRGPLAELGRPCRVHPKADGDDGVEIVKARRVVLSVLRSMSEIPTHCRFGQFPAVEDVFQVLGDGAAPLVEEHTDELLRKPDRFLRQPHLNALVARLPGKDKELRRAVPDSEFLVLAHGLVSVGFELFDDFE